MGYLRTILAITVVLAHSPWHNGFVFVGGTNAVQLFYIISGFLICHVLTTNETYRNPLKFYINRILRLYPIYYFIAICSFLLHIQRFYNIFSVIPGNAVILLALSNLFLLGQDWLLFFGVTNQHIVFISDLAQSDFPLYRGHLVPQAWTLGLELTFYAMAPFIIRRKAVIFLLLASSIATRIFLFSIGLGDRDPWTYRFFPAELSLFLLGALSCQYLLPAWKRILSWKHADRFPKLGTCILVFATLVYFLVPVSESIKTPVLFFLFITLLPLAFLFQNASATDRTIGELSYPIYIGHLFALDHIGRLLRVVSRDPLVTSVVNVIVAVVIAYFLNKYIARRVEQLRSAVKSGAFTLSSPVIGRFLKKTSRTN